MWSVTNCNNINYKILSKKLKHNDSDEPFAKHPTDILMSQEDNSKAFLKHCMFNNFLTGNYLKLKKCKTPNAAIFNFIFCRKFHR
jgi:hypothetical protein